VTAAVKVLRSPGPATAEMLECLRPAAQEKFGAGVAGLTRTPSRYSTSFAIENCELTLTDGRVFPLVFKNLSPDALLPQARRARPSFVFAPEREIQVYRDLLAGAGLGTARLFAADDNPEFRRYWLFIERVDGVELYQVEDLEVWKRAARWLGELHRRIAPEATGDLAASLTRYDAEWYRLWMRRAAAFTVDPAIDRLVGCHGKVVEHLCALPPTVIHGDFYASNVLSAGEGRICPVDWERASVGPGLLDLASLITGWDEASAARIARAYAGRFGVDHRSLAMCRLHQCIQWLGWSPGWAPPAEHRHDWLNCALRLVGELGL
jgi:aminoglycoside phosphotransferase